MAITLIWTSVVQKINASLAVLIYGPIPMMEQRSHTRQILHQIHIANNAENSISAQFVGMATI